MTALHKHHRKRRSQGGDDSYGNLLELAPEVHELVHRNPEVAYKHGLLVHSYDDPAAIPPDLAGFLSDLGVEGDAGSVEPKPKKPRKLEGEAAAKRKKVSIHLPKGVEGAYWDDLLSDAEKTELEQPDTKFKPELGGVTTGKLLIAILERFTGRIG